MYSFEKIKLVIWDMDETFWHGTLSEGAVEIPVLHAKLVKRLTDIGIVNSICSKNDYEKTMNTLTERGMADYFVFPSINWEAKGPRVNQLIQDMQLRPANVLFLDDNHSNREEVKYFCPEIMAEAPDVIEKLYQEAMDSTKKDYKHKRLKQYRILEEKKEEKKNFTSNEEFLLDSNIRVLISNDCLIHIERIHDLIMRTNQLNFTKNRSSLDELKKTLEDPSIDAGYCEVKDRFGEYGITGFYALKDNELIHFVFSCRILGMGVEQYVYNHLNRPKLTIVGEVISDLSSEISPGWINQDVELTKKSQMKIKNLEAHKVLIKGPCDLYQIFPYIADTELFDTEFTYTNKDGVGIETTGHTTHIVESLRLTEEQKNRVINEVPFSDPGIYNDSIFKYDYKVVIISILTDANMGVYRRKETGERIALLEYLYPITDPDNWDGYISGKYDSRGFKFTKEDLRNFSRNYEFIGRNTPEDIVDNLTYIRSNLAEECCLVIMLGGEIYYEKNKNEAYEDRHIVHKEMNGHIRKWASDKKNVKLIDVNKYVVDQSSFYDHFNHYIKPVYYEMAKEIVTIVNEWTGSSIKETSRLKMIQVRLKEILAPYYYRLKKLR